MKYLIQEECFYTPEEIFELNKEKASNNKFRRVYHKAKEEFNSERFKQKYSDKLTLKVLTKIFNDKVLRLKYEIPEMLYKQVEHVIKLEYYANYISEDKRKKRVYETKLEQALYLCLAVMCFNQNKNAEIQVLKHKVKRENIELDIEKLNKIRYKYDVEYGNELSKNILTSIITNKDFYTIKEILIRHKIVRKYSVI